MKITEYHDIAAGFCKENGLNIRFSTDMPDGCETANGTFDISKNTFRASCSQIRRFIALAEDAV